MAPRTFKDYESFKYFARRPIELRAAIWGIAIEDDSDGRVIRVESRKGYFKMSGGKAPKWLWLCKDSREAALRVIPCIHANLGLPAKDAGSSDRIWVNFNVDTLYVVGTFNSQDYLDWLQNLAQEANLNNVQASNVVRYLAFPLQNTFNQLFKRGYGPPSRSNKPRDRSPLVYALCASHHSLKTIALIDDRSRFKITQRPGQYSIGEMRTALRPEVGSRRHSIYVYNSLRRTSNFFKQPCSASDFWKQKFESLKKQQNVQWVPPTFPIYGITKTKRRD